LVVTFFSFEGDSVLVDETISGVPELAPETGVVSGTADDEVEDDPSAEDCSLEVDFGNI
jgi:hypothetical protein